MEQYWTRLKTQNLLHGAFLPGWIVFAIFLIGFAFAERQTRIIHAQTERAEVREAVALVQSRMESIIHSDIQLLRGLVASVSLNPEMTQEEFSALSHLVVDENEDFFGIAIAPDLIVTLVHPIERHQNIIGLNYNDNAGIAKLARQTRITREMVFSGPIDLLDGGGTGFVARFPIFVERDGVEVFWGIVSSVLDEFQLYEGAGLLNPELGLSLAIRGRDGRGANGEVFYGDPELFYSDAVISEIVLPVGTWQLAAVPQAGWTTSTVASWWVRGPFILIGFLVLIPTFLMCSVSQQRNAMIKSLSGKERLLRHQSQELKKLSTVVESASDSIVISDKFGRIQWVNQAFTDLTGYSFDEAVGQTPGQILNGPDTDQETIAQTEQHVKSGKPYRTELLNYTKDGRKIWIETYLVPTRDETGEVIFTAAIERDVTAAKRQEAELAHAKDVAEKATKAKSEFVAAMSHEIRTPMNGIIGMSDLLRETELPAEAHGHVKIVHESAQSLLAIINDILDLSSLEAGKLGISARDFDLRKCIEGAVGLVRATALNKGLKIVVEMADDLPYFVSGDDGRIRQILLNLLGNAVKFTAEGQITLRARSDKQDPHTLHIEVEDTGIGLSDEQMPYVFDRFAQADAGIARKFGGTGLGLSIVRHLVNQMGGAVSVRSELEKGSCFSLTIQVAPVLNAPKVELMERPINLAVLRGRRLLLVEDNGTNRFLIHRFLKDAGLEIWDAKDGLEAIDVFEQVQPDIVLMDMSMPKLDGVEATRRIRAMKLPQPPIIALTANAFESDRKACLNAGMNDFLSKPLQKMQLLAALVEYLERHDKQVDTRQVEPAI